MERPKFKSLVTIPGWLNMNADLSFAIRERFQREADSQRYLAREIHDTVANHVVSANLLLGQLIGAAHDEQVRRSLGELHGELDLALRDLRSFCFLLDVPDEFEDEWGPGLHSVIHGFSIRAGLRLTYANSAEHVPMSDALRTVILRILQEALVNVVRHAKAHKVSVAIRPVWPGLEVAVTDDGCGIPGMVRPGVGLRSMAARAREIGGTFSISSSNQGTTVTAILPIE